jgi:3-phenylpropionate/trans-cinnamate dioxygenase ferredoxin reductase component
VTSISTIVVVGASLTGGTAASALRDQGYDGRLVLIGDDTLPPYERPGLSKRYLRGEESVAELFVRTPDWWEAHGVEARLGERVHRLDPVDRTVTLDDGQSITFDRALIATGVRNRRLDVPGSEMTGVHALRTVADADAIRRDVAEGATRVVVVGMGFIGAEVAASLRTMGLDVMVVEIFETALYRALGPTFGRVVEAAHRDQGVQMIFHDTVERFEGGERVDRVVTRGGRELACDFVVVGVGTEPAAELLRDGGVAANGGVAVGPGLETIYPGVFAAGDVATHEHPLFGSLRVEHFDNAVKMGEHVGGNMLGAEVVFDDPHWFWSDQYEHQIQMAGVAPAGEHVVVRGSVQERRFCAFLLDEAGVLRSTVSLDWPRDCRRSLPLIRAAARPDPVALADPEIDIRRLVHETS